MTKAVKHALQSQEVVPTQVTTVKCPIVCGVTETGHVVKVEITEQQKRDPLFWQSLRNIQHKKLWLPMSKTKHHFLEEDWLAVS